MHAVCLLGPKSCSSKTGAHPSISYTRSNLVTFEKLEMMISLYISEWMFWLVVYNNTCGPSLWWEPIQPWERVQGSGLQSARVRRFTTQPEGHKPVAWAPVLISRSFSHNTPVTSQLIIWGSLNLQDVGVVDTCSPTLLPDHGDPSVQGVSQVKADKITILGTS